MFPNHKTEQLIIGIVLIVALIVALMFKNDSPIAQTSLPVQSTEEVKSNGTDFHDKKVDLGMTLENFCERYNVAILNVDARLKQCTLDPAKEEFTIDMGKRTFLHFFPEGVNMRGEIDFKTNRLAKIEIGCDVYESRITEWLHSAIYDAAIAAVSPNLTKKERAKIIDAVEYETYTRESSPIVIDGITFHTSRYKGFVTSIIQPLI